MASVFLAANENWTQATSNSSIFGSNGTETVILQNGVTGVTVNTTTESVNLSAYTGIKFQSAGNLLKVYAADGTTLLSTITLQQDANGTLMTLPGSTTPVSAFFNTTNGAVTIGGSAVSSTTPTALAATLNIVPVAAAANEGTNSTFTVSRAGDTTAASTVAFTLTGTGGATIGTDTGTLAVSGSGVTSSSLTASSGTINFAAGATSATITVPFLTDALSPETGEGVTVTLSSPTGAALGSTVTATTTITDVAAATATLTTGIDTATGKTDVSGILSATSTDRTWGLTDTVSGTSATTDSMNVTVIGNGTATAVDAYAGLSTTDIENFNFRYVDGGDGAGGATINASSFTGATKIALKNGVTVNTTSATTDDTITFNSVAPGVSLELANNSKQLNVAFNNTGTATAGDSFALALGGNATGDVTLRDANAGEGFDIVNVTTGTAASTLQKLDAGTDFITLNINGTQGLTITDALASTLTTINAGGNSGAVKLTSASTGALTATGSTVTGDQLTLNAIPSTPTISGFETVVVGAATSALNLATVTGATKLGVASGLTSAAFTNAAATTNTINLSGNYQPNGAALTTSTSLTTGTVAYTPVTAAATTGDTLTVAVDNGGTANTGTYIAGALTATNVESLTLTTADWTAVTLGGVNQTVASTVAGSVTASGASNLALGTIANIGGLSQTTGVDTYNFGGVNGTLSATMAGTGNLSVTGAAGADTLTINAAMTSDASVTTQTYNLGTGDDKITVNSGKLGTNGITADHLANKLVLNGGAGGDQFVFTPVADMNTDEVTIAGGDGTDTLLVHAIATGSLTINSLSGVEAVVIDGTAMANAAATDGVFFNVATGYADAMSITDVTAGVNRVSFTAASGGTASLANLTFVGFAPGTGTDILALNGQAGAESLTGSSGADVITGGAGADSIDVGANTTEVIDVVTIAAGDSVVTIAGATTAGTMSGNDVISNFQLGTGALNSDELAVGGTGALGVIGTFAQNGTDSTLQLNTGVAVRSHSITDGIITFDDVDTTFATAVSLTTAGDVAAAAQYLTTNDIGAAGDTLAFVATISGTAHTYVYTQSGADAGGDLVDLVGVTATSLIAANATTAGALFIS